MPHRPTLSQGGLSIRLEQVRQVSRIGTDPVTVVYTGWSHSSLKAAAITGEWKLASSEYGTLTVVIDSVTRLPAGLQLVFSSRPLCEADKGPR